METLALSLPPPLFLLRLSLSSSSRLSYNRRFTCACRALPQTVFKEEEKEGTLLKEQCTELDGATQASEEDGSFLTPTKVESGVHASEEGSFLTCTPSDKEGSFLTCTPSDEEESFLTWKKLESGTQGSVFSSEEDEEEVSGLTWKERERRRKIGETRRRTNRECMEDKAGVRKEMERRRKISETKRGSVPWNLGKKHSQETKEKIGRGISNALRDPKARMNMKGMKGKEQSQKAKELISQQAKRIWAVRLKSKRSQQSLLKTWSLSIANSAQSGGPNQSPLDWDEYNKIMQEFNAAEMLMENERREERERRKAREDIDKRMKERKKEGNKEEGMFGRKGKIRVKYGTQGFNLDLKKRLSRLHDKKKKLESSSNVKEMERIQKSDEWDIEFIKQRLEVGVSFSSQLEMARNRKKQEKIDSE